MISLISTSKFCVITVTTVKNAASTSWLIKLLLIILTYLEPLKNMYHLVAGVILVNLVVGFYKNKKLFKEHWNSKKAWKTIEKIGLFTIYVIFVYTFETQILYSRELFVSRIICGILILSEAKSISENGDAILNTKLFIPFFKKLVNLFDKKI